ncbi:MFS transporter [Lentibacillus sp. Marseille-P4043]|uniref:MFS transporter n=1 Tax=Lentibacillus sp. Marseille-P4043 TaxID=2040293 RepID=UPI000D0B4F25|nr:MFS transporter [Lentibacillus sp. Marseille-P4043]
MEEKLPGERKSLSKEFYFLCIGTFFVMFSLATHLPAYPHILEEFGLNAGYAVWMQLGLALGLTGFQPLLGWLGDERGLKVTLLIGATCMILGSLLAAIQISYWLLIVGLFLQGMAGAATAPAGVSYAGKFYVGELRGKALGAFYAFSVLGALFGPFVSGIVVDSMGWAFTFVLTGIFGVVAFLLFLFGVPAVKSKKRGSLDLSGIILTLIVLGGLLTIPTFINNYGFSSGAWLPSLAVFAIALLVLIVVEKKKKDPLLDINYTKHRNFWVPTLTIVLVGIGYSGVMYLLTFFVQGAQGKSATVVGILQMLIFLGSAGGALLSGKIIKRFTARVMTGVGLGLFLIGLVLLAMTNIDTSSVYIGFSLLLVGFGMSFTQPIMKAVIVSTAKSDRINVITFTNTVIENTAQRIGASFSLVAVALFASIGDKASALSNTTLIYAGFALIAFFLLGLIPNKIEGIHNVSGTPTNNLKIDADRKVQ